MSDLSDRAKHWLSHDMQTELTRHQMTLKFLFQSRELNHDLHNFLAKPSCSYPTLLLKFFELWLYGLWTRWWGRIKQDIGRLLGITHIYMIHAFFETRCGTVRKTNLCELRPNDTMSWILVMTNMVSKPLLKLQQGRWVPKRVYVMPLTEGVADKGESSKTDKLKLLD